MGIGATLVALLAIAAAAILESIFKVVVAGTAVSAIGSTIVDLEQNTFHLFDCVVNRYYEDCTSMSPNQNTTEEPETFEAQSGVITIDNEKIDVDVSVMKGFKQVYEHSALVFFLLIALFASGITIMIFSQRFYIVAIRDAIVAFVLLFSIFLILRRIGVRFGVIDDATVIPLDSVKRAEYKKSERVNYSRLYIIYEKDGSEKRQGLAISFPIIGGSGRLESAIQALNNKGIETSSM